MRLPAQLWASNLTSIKWVRSLHWVHVSMYVNVTYTKHLLGIYTDQCLSPTLIVSVLIFLMSNLLTLGPLIFIIIEFIRSKILSRFLNRTLPKWSENMTYLCPIISKGLNDQHWQFITLIQISYKQILPFPICDYDKL